MVTAALINDTLTQIGALGGVLSIVGTGLLILLVASQSRQIRSMRDWIEQEPQRQQETAQRVIAEVQRRIAAARERRTGAATPPVPGAAIPKAPPAPGTLGATPEAKRIAAEKAGDETQIQPAVPGGDGPAPPAFAPLTAAGSVAPPTVDDDEPAIVSEILNQETQLSDALPDEEFGDIPSVPASRGVDARFSDEHFDLEDDDHPRSNRLLFGAGGALVVAGIIFLGTQLFGGSGTKSDTGSGSTGTADTSQSDTPKKSTPVKKTTPFDPSKVTVRVFNATTISGLGQRTSDILKAANYNIDATPQTLSPTQTSTTVLYRPGQKTAASHVVSKLGLSQAALQVMDSSTAATTSMVVVHTGSDLNAAGAVASTTG
jgi:hypothetical protein